jgi:hypothetical protein
MTTITHVGSVYMRRRFANRGDAIVTRRTGTDYLGVINLFWRPPGDSGMTEVTFIGGADVVWWFGSSLYSIMTGRATIHDASMVKQCTQV